MTNASTKANENGSNPSNVSGADKVAKANPRVRGEKNLRGKSGKANQQGSSRSGRSRSFPVVQKKLAIDHPIVKSQFERWVDVYKQAFYHTTSMFTFLGMEDSVDRVHEYLVEMIEAQEAEMTAATDAVVANIRRKADVAEIPKTSVSKDEIDIEIPGFVVARYVDMFPVADKLVDTCVYAECVGALKWTERTAMLKSIPKYLRAPAGRFQSFAAKLGKRQQLNEAQAKEAREQAQLTLDSLLKPLQENSTPSIIVPEPNNVSAG